MPDVMCSLETFVTDLTLWQGSFFLAAASEQKEAEKQYEFLEHIRRALFKLRGADMADGGHVGHRCPAHLPCHRQKVRSCR